MSLNKSRKGFKKLETLEMMDLDGGGNLLEDSDSETDLLDLTDTMKGCRSRSYPSTYSRYSQ